MPIALGKIRKMWMFQGLPPFQPKIRIVKGRVRGIIVDSSGQSLIDGPGWSGR